MFKAGTADGPRWEDAHIRQHTAGRQAGPHSSKLGHPPAPPYLRDAVVRISVLEVGLGLPLPSAAVTLTE